LAFQFQLQVGAFFSDLLGPPSQNVKWPRTTPAPTPGTGFIRDRIFKRAEVSRLVHPPGAVLAIGAVSSGHVSDRLDSLASVPYRGRRGRRRTRDYPRDHHASGQAAARPSRAVAAFDGVGRSVSDLERPGGAVGVPRERVGQNLDGDVALQPRIARAINLTRTAGAKGTDNFIGTDSRTGRQRHVLRAAISFRLPPGQLPAIIRLSRLTRYRALLPYDPLANGEIMGERHGTATAKCSR